MEIDVKQLEPAALAAWGFQAACLLYAEDWDGLVRQFAYALAFDDLPQAAVRRDLAASLAELGGSMLLPPAKQDVRVRYFSDNNAGLVAEIEQSIPTDGAGRVVLTCVVSRRNKTLYGVLEHIWAQADAQHDYL
ncbi:hypothetical protein L1281_001287 [Neisseria sp. HSC-16F19]|nr:hypothetical protein [Neisseria sp. HSC-16F19]MCP2040698.1 hypothetical protein [Neisseria sp. HSC-16F19]